MEILDEHKIKEELFKIFKESLKEVVGLNLEELNKETTLNKLNLDSIDLLDLVTRVEGKIRNRLNVNNYQIPDEYFTELRESNLDKLIEIIYKSLSNY